MNLCVGIVEIVLSQFWTLTVCSAMSMTSPSQFACGTLTQSPMRIMSFDAIWTLATSDRIVSRKISMRTAASAPRPERKNTGDRPARIATITTPAARWATSATTCR